MIKNIIGDLTKEINNLDFLIATPIAVVLLRTYIWEYVYNVTIITDPLVLGITLPMNFIIQTYISSVVGAIVFIGLTKLSSWLSHKILNNDITQKPILT